MSDKTVLFFDDYPQASESAVFVADLRSLLAGTRFELNIERTVAGCEVRLREEHLAVAVLDIMAKTSPPLKFHPVAGGATVPQGLTGLELLSRSRSGFYGEHGKSLPVYLRSARGDQRTRELCARFGGMGLYLPGRDDESLLKAIRKELGL